MSITLVGMCGVGKSSVGGVLARCLGWPLVDLDHLLDAELGCAPQAFLDREGEAAYLAREEAVVLRQEAQPPRVLAPGGSVVYSRPAMDHLRRISRVVYLCDDLANIRPRLTDLDTRAVVGLRRLGLEGLYAERTGLYAAHCHLAVDLGPCATPEEAARAVMAGLGLTTPSLSGPGPGSP